MISSRRKFYSIENVVGSADSSWRQLYSLALMSGFLSYDYFYGNFYYALLAFFPALVLVVFLSSSSLRSFSFSKAELFLGGVAFFLYFIFFSGLLVDFEGSSFFLLLSPLPILFALKNAGIKNLEKATFLLLFVVVVLALFEHLKGGYLYEKSIYVGGSELVLGKDFFSGSTGLLRAKSIFIGPLTFSAFLISSSIVLRGSKLGLGLCLFGALLSTSRTAIIITSLVFVFNQVGFRSDKFKTTVMIGLLVVVATFFLAYFYSDYIPRLFDVFNFSDSGANSYRLNFWLIGLKEFSGYDFYEIIFGNSGYFRDKYGNNAESGWITLLLDFGLLGFLGYLLPLFFSAVKSKGYREKFSLFAVLLSNFVFTFCYGFIGCFLYWLCVYSLLVKRERYFWG